MLIRIGMTIAVQLIDIGISLLKKRYKIKNNVHIDVKTEQDKDKDQQSL